MSERQRHKTLEPGQDASFGFVFSAFFALVSLYPLVIGNGFRVWALVVSLCFLAPALLAPRVLRPMNWVWFKFGLLLGAVVSPVVMGVIYFLVFTPVGLLRRAFGNDTLGLKFNKRQETYWVSRDSHDDTMADQF